MKYSEIAVAFRAPKAKFDFITISIPNVMVTEIKTPEYQAQGRIELARKPWENWLTIHDPTLSDLQWLLDHAPESPILAIEIAVDWTLADGSSDDDQLMALHGWLNHRLFPQRHEELVQAKRFRFDPISAKYLPDTVATTGGDTTFQWRDSKQRLRIRLYRKSLDNGTPLEGQQRIRLEANLGRSACQHYGLYRVAELPQFADLMRRELSDGFFVASWIKPKLARSRANTPGKAQEARQRAKEETMRVARAWERCGAQWAAKHGHEAKPDTAANRAIGLALKQLREKMLPLKLTRKVAEIPSYEVTKVQQK